MYAFSICVLLFNMVDMDKYKYYEVSVDSLYADGAFKSSVSKLDWPQFQLANALQQISFMKLLQAEIPFSYYPFNTKNNTFGFSDTSGVYTATIPAGQYTITTLSAALSLALNNLTGLSPPGSVYSTSFNNQTQKLEITSAAGDFSFTFGTSDDNGDTNPRLWLGFNAGVNLSFSNVLVAPNVASITGPNYLYVKSTSLGPLFNIYATTTNQASEGGLGAHIAKIPCNTNPGGVIEYTDPCPQQWFDMENLNVLQKFDIYMTKGGGQSQVPLEFNGQPFSLKFGVLVKNDSVSRGERQTSKKIKRGA